jgi:hypothetical protein
MQAPLRVAISSRSLKSIRSKNIKPAGEAWEPRIPDFLRSLVAEKLKVDGVGIPHLAKNERDMGHPGFLGQDKA